jgi:cysteine desulfurase
VTIYLDCAATTPIDPRVRDEVLRYLAEDFGNAGSRTHDYGRRARSAVERARDRVAAVVECARGDVVFTSGATESNNLAILGLARHGEAAGRTHIVSTAIEHHAVLEPLAELERRGFEIDYVEPGATGVVDAAAVAGAVRADTLVVSVMHVNNETGIIQPIEEIASRVMDDGVFLHVDAAQGFAKEIAALRHPRIDLISVSGHKIHAPKGVGALIVRRARVADVASAFRRTSGRLKPAATALEPIMFGGGQERGLRPGTLPVHLIAGLGLAAELALDEAESRAGRCRDFRDRLLSGLAPLQPVVNGDPTRSAPHIVNLALPGIDAEAVIEAWQDIVAISHGAACTSQTYTCSHVLSAMGLAEWQKDGAVRLSWCHATEMPDVSAMVEAIERVRSDQVTT